MTESELKSLNVGDVVYSYATKQDYVVTGNYGDHVTAVRTVDITNPVEWLVFRKVRPIHPAGLSEAFKAPYTVSKA